MFQNGYYGSNVISNVFLGKTVGKKTVVVVMLFFWRLLASSGALKLSVSSLPFKRSLSRLERSSAASILTNFWTAQKFHLFVSIQTTQRQCFQHFPIFGRFGSEQTSRRVRNLVVSVSNTLFWLRFSFSAFIFGRKRIFEKESGNWIWDFFLNSGF